jgi:hypothetical protein
MDTYEFTCTRFVTETAVISVPARTIEEARAEAEDRVKAGDVLWEETVRDVNVEREPR